MGGTARRLTKEVLPIVVPFFRFLITQPVQHIARPPNRKMQPRRPLRQWMRSIQYL